MNANKKFWNTILVNVTKRIATLEVQAQQEANGELATGFYYRKQLATALQTQATAQGKVS